MAMAIPIKMLAKSYFLQKGRFAVRMLHGDDFFRPGEWFCIVRHAEASMEKRTYHFHDFLEICYVSAGSGYHAVGDTEYRVGKGDLFLINDGTTHAFFRGEDDEELITYNLLFKPAFFDDRLLPFDDFTSLSFSYLFRGAWEEEQIREDLHLSVRDQEQVEKLLQDMMREYALRPPGYQAVIRAHMIMLIVILMRGFQGQGEDDHIVRRRQSLIESAIRHLNEHYQQDIQIEQLARQCFFSKNYFARLFKETTGMSVNQYGQRIRIEQACQLMRATDKTLSEIAVEVGYADYKTFFSAFRKQKGVSPQAYRTEHSLAGQ